MSNFCKTCLTILLLLTNLGACQRECREQRCGRHGLRIRFPFRIKDRQPHHCGYPGFDLSCSDNHALLELPAGSGPVKLFIIDIDYESQILEVYDPQSCLPRQFLRLYHSGISPFNFEPPYGNLTYYNIFFNCSSVDKSCPIHAAELSDSFLSAELLFCTRMFDISSSLVSSFHLRINYLSLTWSTPNCSTCEAKGMICKLKNNGTEDAVECLDHDPNPKIPKSTIIAAAGGTASSIVLLLLLLALFQIYRYLRTKEEDQVRVENFLEDYKALKLTRFSYADLKRITNHFKDKIGEGAHGTVFKGKLSSEIPVAVKILNDTEGDGKEFINEVGTMGKIHHVNVVRLLGFCAEGFYRALIYNFFPYGSLQNFVSSPDNKEVFLGWEKLQLIAIGIAKGIEYLHQDCDHRILHFDINPRNVLLDQNFVPKISDFGLAKLCSKSRSIVSMTTARGTIGYIAPEVFSRNFGNVSYKSDIYSYGMLLLEMVGGRKDTNTTQDSFQILYPEWIHKLVEGRDIINIHIEDDEDIRIAKKLAIVGLWCIQWHPVNRPSIKAVIQMLEGEGDKLKVPPSPFESTASTSTNTSAIIPLRCLNLELEVIHEDS